MRIIRDFRKIALLVFCCLLVYCSCKKEGTNSASQKQNSNTAQPNNSPHISVPANMTPVSGPPTTQHSPQNPKGIWHFTCPKGCPGGGGDASPCQKCGMTLVHNQAYHQ
ncbi:MAG: hypothetical protein U0V49_12630 [Saprospiraceae bacterium]